MKIADLNGNWVGLAYTDGYPYSVDYFSSPDGWKIGFDIVYRLIFILDDKQRRDERLGALFRSAFREASGLSDEHYKTQDWPTDGNGDSVFWRIYWDRQAFYLKLLKKCEDSLNECAERTKTKVLLLDMVIIPRSENQIAELVKQNRESS